MSRVEGWVREDENTWDLKMADGDTKKTIIIQEDSNKIMFIDRDRGKRKYAFPPSRNILSRTGLSSIQEGDMNTTNSH